MIAVTDLRARETLASTDQVEVVRRPSARPLVAATQLLIGIALIVWPGRWQQGEAFVAAHAIEAITRHHTLSASAFNVLLMYRDSSLLSVFRITSECSTAYLVGALTVISSPLILIRRFRLFAVSLAIIIAALFLTIVNTARLTIIGAAVSWWGPDRGFSFAHTYLGTAVTFLGTAAVGVVFVAALLTLSRDRSITTVDG